MLARIQYRESAAEAVEVVVHQVGDAGKAGRPRGVELTQPGAVELAVTDDHLGCGHLARVVVSGAHDGESTSDRRGLKAALVDGDIAGRQVERCGEAHPHDRGSGWRAAFTGVGRQFLARQPVECQPNRRCGVGAEEGEGNAGLTGAFVSREVATSRQLAVGASLRQCQPDECSGRQKAEQQDKPRVPPLDHGVPGSARPSRSMTLCGAS